MTYETVDGREWENGDLCDQHVAKLERLQAFADRHVGVVPMEVLKAFCNGEALK